MQMYALFPLKYVAREGLRNILNKDAISISFSHGYVVIRDRAVRAHQF